MEKVRRAAWRIGVAAGIAALGASIAPFMWWPRTAARPEASAPPSGDGEGVGVGSTCGVEGTEPCCESRGVPETEYRRAFDGIECEDDRFDARVSSHGLDRFQVTVGRFRRFIEAGGGTRASPPAEGSGAHARIGGSGWQPEWNDALAASTADMRRELGCGPSATWTDETSANDDHPINCVSWYEAFAFCAWDGGRLPTEAEWNAAAAGGAEQRERPWSAAHPAPIDRGRAVFGELHPMRVGSCSPAGDGRWGHADLVGNVWEWTLDANEGTELLPNEGASRCAVAGLPMPCDDCANLEARGARVLRGGGFGMPGMGMRVAYRRADEPTSRFPVFGIRCARDGAAAALVASGDAPVAGPAEQETPARTVRSPTSLRVGDRLPPYSFRGALAPGGELRELEAVRLETLLSDLPADGPRRLLLAYVCAWSPGAASLVRSVHESRDALRDRGVGVLIVLADGNRRGQTADGLDLAHFARTHGVSVPIAMDATGAAVGACETALVVDAEGSEVAAVYEGADAALAQLLPRGDGPPASAVSPGPGATP